LEGVALASAEGLAGVMADVMAPCAAIAAASAIAAEPVFTAAALTVVGDIMVEATAEEDTTVVATAAGITVMAAGAGAAGGGPDTTDGGRDITDGGQDIMRDGVTPIIPTMAIIRVPRLW
jgi:hypothetical protein